MQSDRPLQQPPQASGRAGPGDAIRYLRIALAVSLGLLPAVAAFCWAMDPYSVFGIQLPGWNDVKKGNNDRIAFAYDARNSRADTLLLGNSRLRAFDAGHPLFGGSPPLMLRLAGTDIWELEHFFEHALASAPIRRAVLLVDFVNFNAAAARGAQRPSYLIAPGERERDWRREIATLGPMLFSVDGLDAAIGTLRASRARRTEHEDHERFGTRGLFRETERGFAKAGGAYTPGLSRTYRFEDPRMGEDSFAPFWRILASAHRRGIELHLVISPSHARMWQVVDSLGLWDQWETWKRRIVAANEGIASQNGGVPFPLWDFSGFNSVTTAPVPPDDGEPMRLYDETSHYGRPVGDMVLQRIFGAASESIPPDFGVRLTSANLEASLTSTRAARDAWQRAHPGEAMEVAAQVL